MMGEKLLQLFSVNPPFIIVLFLYVCVSSQLQKTPFLGCTALLRKKISIYHKK